jgi:hypothetical protein
LARAPTRGRRCITVLHGGDDNRPGDADRGHRSGRTTDVPYREQRSTVTAARANDHAQYRSKDRLLNLNILTVANVLRRELETNQ